MNTRPEAPPIPAAVTAAWGIDPGTVERLRGGHINLTFAARLPDGRRCVIQRINPIFPAVVNRDLAAVADHLLGKGLASPALIRTRSGEDWIETDEGVWRALSYIEGTSSETLHTSDQARAAGLLLGRFHQALGDLSYEFQSVRSDPHDLDRHLATLASALADHAGHRNFSAVAATAADILDAAGAVTLPDPGPARVVHGDPKISNVLFDRETGAGVCLVDLDTLGRRGIVAELGDAFRSWCNPAGEDAADAGFSLPLFQAAIAGYATGSGTLLTPPERLAIPAATHAIGIELAARFCADALNERFFHWDRTRFADASAHNLARARAQLAVGRQALAARDAMLETIAAAFADGGP